MLRDALYALEGIGMEVVGEGGRGWGKGGVEVGWGVGKEGERKEGDFVILWCSF